MTKGFNDHEVYWEWGVQGAPFSTGVPYTLKAKISLNATTITDQSDVEWTFICESIFNPGPDETEEHADWEEPVTVNITGCGDRV